MSQEPKRSETRRVRPASAKASTGMKHRTLSSKSHKLDNSDSGRVDTKIDTLLLYRNSRYSGQGIGLNLGDEELQKLRPAKVTKSKELLYDENMHLKQTMNQMSSELRTLRTKMERNRRRNLKYTTKLDMEFEKNLYWPSTPGSYLVMGVKNQYEKLQEENKILKRDLEGARKVAKYTQLQERLVELDALQEQNMRLKEELDKLIRIYKMQVFGQLRPENLYESNKDNAAAKDILIEQLRRELKKCRSDISSYEEGLSNLNGMIKDRDEKIEFLEKRIIEKENISFTLQTKSNKLTQDNELFKQRLKQLKDEESQRETEAQRKIQIIRELEKKRSAEEMMIFHKELQDRDAYISKLEKEIGYLSALLKEWKPLDPHPEAKPRVQVLPPSDQAPNKRKGPDLSLNIIKQKSWKALVEAEHARASSDPNQLVVLSDQQSPSRKVNNHYTLKRKKVKPEDIKEICLETKYRLINRNVDILAAKGLLVGGQNGLISIGQVIAILQQQPFALSDIEKRTLLARYLVEDSDEAIVYYDQQAQNDASIVRSIFQQIIPKYTVWKEDGMAKIKARVVDLLTQFYKSLSQIVTQANKQQLVSWSKFTDILTQQELNSNPDVTDFMIIHMLEGSTGLDALNFKKLQELLPQ